MVALAAPTSGLLLFIRYAFMPNRLGYCGGNENDLLFEHAVEGVPDLRLAPLLVKFTGAVPYLRTIAHANGIADPFDSRVVDAYWIGNELLERVEARDLYRSLEDRFGTQLTPKMREVVLRKAPQGARPYHLFHVIDVYRHLEGEEVGMAAIDSCRVSWGEVKQVEDSSLLVERQPVIVRDGKFVLGEAQTERVARALSDKGFVEGVGVGDWVSIHWGWACEILDPARLANLERYSRHHLLLANQTV
ncbi:MAG TPA: DUF6390 family protein [Candidatus Sulfotelmatobacter sp.]|nr:DUF6390 family protein [Candidatus Sulfotelmatobacter sp.]